jgi:homoserine dehydrogenase
VGFAISNDKEQPVTTTMHATTWNLALIGFGNVGQGFAEILKNRGDALAGEEGARFRIVAVSDLHRGAVADPNGLDPAALLSAVQSGGLLDNIPAPHRGWDALQTIEQSGADILLELSYTDLTTGEPATTHIRNALSRGMHVVTTNKGPVALHYPELAELAAANDAEIGAEGTVMSGTPVLRLATELLAGVGIQRMQGILNGTTNFILTKMESGQSYADALADAQARGFAEADPTGDVEGFDAAGKTVILANLLLGASLTLRDVDRIGITGLTQDDIAEASAAGERWKLIGTVERTASGATASVRPQRVPLSHPLAGVSGATNAITFTTDLLGDVTVVGPGAGRTETGFALLGDLLAIHRKTRPRSA